MENLDFKYNDGGRSIYFKGKNVGDCVVRAVAIATGIDYKEVYDTVSKIAGKTPRNGVAKEVTNKLLQEYGWTWVPTMLVGQGCKVHLRKDELPQGTIICRTSKHLTTVIDGVINDTFDCSRGGTRCVYGYWIKK